MKNEILNFFHDRYVKTFINYKPEVINKILEIILSKDDLILDSVQTQFNIDNLKYRSIILDVLAKDIDNNIYNIEFQNKSNDELLERARYHHGMIDSSVLNKNSKFKDLKKTYVIFICNFDPFKQGKPLYVFKRKEEKGNDIEYIDGDYTIFVNCKYKDTSTDIGKLICDLTRSNKEDKWYNVFKEGNDIGGESMGDGLERWEKKVRNEGKREGKKEGLKEGINLAIKGLLKLKCSNELISEACNVSYEYIEKIRKNV